MGSSQTVKWVNQSGYEDNQQFWEHHMEQSFCTRPHYLFLWTVNQASSMQISQTNLTPDDVNSTFRPNSAFILKTLVLY